jgi:hypothetical protein
MLDQEMETELSYPVRYVIEMHRGELEDRWRWRDALGLRRCLMSSPRSGAS